MSEYRPAHWKNNCLHFYVWRSGRNQEGWDRSGSDCKIYKMVDDGHGAVSQMVCPYPYCPSYIPKERIKCR